MYMLGMYATTYKCTHLSYTKVQESCARVYSVGSKIGVVRPGDCEVNE